MNRTEYRNEQTANAAMHDRAAIGADWRALVAQPARVREVQSMSFVARALRALGL